MSSSDDADQAAVLAEPVDANESIVGDEPLAPEEYTIPDDVRNDPQAGKIGNYSLVGRMMKNAMPDNTRIAKEARELMQECVSEFISFITSEAAENCRREWRKTLSGEDILFAMTNLGFENYAAALGIYLSKYREQISTGATDNRGPKKGREQGVKRKRTKPAEDDEDNNIDSVRAKETPLPPDIPENETWATP